MKKTKKPLLLLTVFSLLVAFLPACNRSPLDPDEPVTLTMWHNYGGDMQQAMDLLIDEFNSTVGKEQGIIINVTAISSSSELNESLSLIVNGDPGAPDMPDIFTGYPKVGVQFMEKGMLCNLDEYFSEEELDAYIDAFVEEGRLADGGLYVFPIAKSTEILYLNQTLFDRFAAATGADSSKLATFEGLADLAVSYYNWTDGLTPDIENDGKQFFASDAWFNVIGVGMTQLGTDFLDGEVLSLNDDTYTSIFNSLYTPSVKGGFAIYDGYSSDLSKTGDLVCSSGSSAGILFYGDTITHADGTVEEVEYNILPYPTFAGGEKVALQRGGGLMVAKSDEKKEYAAAIFIKWLTAADQNMDFISKTGYLPVTKLAFEEKIPVHLETLEDARIKKMLTAVLSMYEEYDFFFAPSFSGFDALSSKFEKDFKTLLTREREKYLSGEEYSPENAIKELQ